MLWGVGHGSFASMRSCLLPLCDQSEVWVVVPALTPAPPRVHTSRKWTWMVASSAVPASDQVPPGMCNMTSKLQTLVRRALTCWDAISDLPPIPAGHDQLNIAYNTEPQSHVCVAVSKPW